MITRAVSLETANAIVSMLHRHHKPVVGHKFSIGAISSPGILAGVVIIGRPVARALDDGRTVEVLRMCTDGTHNACSFLYGAAARAAFTIGYERIVTYILPEEGGASLRASGWKMTGTTPGRSWSVPSREREDKHPLGIKERWEKCRN